jgi:hypothetical protein
MATPAKATEEAASQMRFRGPRPAITANKTKTPAKGRVDHHQTGASNQPRRISDTATALRAIPIRAREVSPATVER